MRKIPWLVLCAWIPVTLLGAVPPVEQVGEQEAPVVIGPVSPRSVQVDLRRAPRVPTGEQAPQPTEVNPRDRPDLPLPPESPETFEDPVRQQELPPDRVPGLVRDFEGISFTGAVPPDPIGDIGPNHYVQMVNTVFAIYDRQGQLLAGPTGIGALWAGTGSRCESGNGDPVVVYDHLADRWVVSQFVNAREGAHLECIAVSQTPDPVVGSWYLYEFPFDEFPDYPKIAVWPDAYYMGSNQGANTGLTAFDRAAMLSGDPATALQFTRASVGFHSMIMPCDCDGTVPPPAGAPGVFYRFIDDGQGGGEDRLELFEVDADFDTPASSSVAGPTTLPVAPFAELCNFSFDCIPQPDTSQKLDSITEWPMWRCAYRNGRDHQTLVGSHAVNVAAPGNQAGVRWYELRDEGGGWSVHQQGTYAPDSENRWMSSIAMDGRGNIALLYSISSSGTYPGLRYTGRLAGDPAGRLRQEAVLVDGSGSQTGFNRWGDYAAVTIDPVDDCTFWLTGMYQPETATADWRTRIGAFRFADSCGPDPFIADRPAR